MSLVSAMGLENVVADKTSLAIEASALSASSKTTTLGAVAGTVGWAAQINWLGLIGALVAVVGLAVNFYFQHQRNKREEEMHRARLDEIKSRCGNEE